MKVILDYIWLDGNIINDIRYLTRIMDVDIKAMEIISYFGKTPRLLNQQDDIEKIPPMVFDGVLTNQVSINESILKPVKLYINPFRENSYYVICEVYDGDQPHKTNSRISLTDLLTDDLEQLSPISLSQNFQIGDSKEWESESIIDDLLNYIIKMNLSVSNIMNKNEGKWEFITTSKNPLILSDDILIVRHLLQRIGNKYSKSILFSNKFFMKISSEKDEINDPYLLTKKLIKSYVK